MENFTTIFLRLRFFFIICVLLYKVVSIVQKLHFRKFGDYSVLY